MKVCIRLNGTSDVAWHKITFSDTGSLFETFPDVQFYDYTPNPDRMGNVPPNYHLTFSRKEDNDEVSKWILNKGHNVAVVFRNKLPDTWHGRPVIDGDVSDLRFNDGHNVVVGLIAKGKARKDTSGFVID
ncbi:hypothetical protein [Zhongshania sp.]|uniref:GP88 family protein n=1 Tax=Zhongshania sp. TaxID=1971902 RepID=UPI0035642A93